MIDLYAFIYLLLIFLVTTSLCFSVVETDMSGYGRMPNLLAEIVSTIRLAFGEFTVIDPYTTFDYKNEDGEYTRDVKIVITTFIIFILSSVFLYLMLMNFIIAVICNTYATVQKYAVAHDYKQRVDMIYELEVLFKESDFINQTYFPNIIIVRKKKENNTDQIESNQGLVKFIRAILKDH